ncbi:YihY family inner membrane protein [Horticoccus luteus]|uniref:YihY family inner membrane protein n=1 Tax=Horticoccus luteus TaxID=2862869 RepID=A0A8F9XMA2_9BACT|nr:YihY/virulence factor BrkB family protein [Horticoccus luteus]QYM80036.1 YihY family inner membrane protein [Horticoccus luteus]
MSRLSTFATRTAVLFRKEIWRSENLQAGSPRAWLYAALRVISITFTVFVETKAASRAAALSFSSLLGLGPLVALTMLLAGFVLDKKDPDLAANTLSRLIYFVAPQVGQYGKLDAAHAHRRRQANAAQATATQPAASAPSASTPATRPSPPAATTTAPSNDQSAPGTTATNTGPDATAPPAIADASDMQLNPRLVRMMDNFINQGSSGKAGTVGFFSLVLIVLLLFKTVEDTFNEIWGVRSGRSLFMRVVYYWTILTLGAVLFFASITLLSAGAFLNIFNETIGRLPFSEQINVALQWSLPAFSFLLVVLLLTIFYRVIPHTRVYWRAAFVGALIVASLLMLNNYLAFLYVRRVILTESLYGSLGFPLVVMFGLYIFWLYVLVGGQVSYAVQNLHFRNSQAAWSGLNTSTRERLSLTVLLAICRRFQACQPPVTAPQLGELIKVPTQILNESINRLVDLKFITPIPPADDAPATDFSYQPARPLNRITMGEFKHRFDNYGDDPAGPTIDRLDPIVNAYHAHLESLSAKDFFSKSVEQLLQETKSGETHAAHGRVPAAS